MSTQMSNNTMTGKDAIEKMIKGIKVATDAIRLSYGAKGCNAVVESEFYPFHQVVNDAQTIVQAIYTDDPIEKRGLGFLKELMDKANKDSRDGRKTTAIIAEEIILGGFKSDVTGVELKRELDALIPVIEREIDNQKRTILLKEVHSVASIAAENEQIGKLIGETYERIGKEGIIHVEGSGTYQTSVSFIDGVRFTDTGFLSPYMVHDEISVKEGRKESKAVYDNPTILVTKRKISHLNDINPLLANLERQNKKDLVIFTDDMDSGVASIMIEAHKSKAFNILIIKAPVLWKNYIFEDFAKVTGSTIVEDASGITFKNLELSHLGTCSRITVDKDETVILGGSDISEHIAELQSKGDNDSLLRLQWLTTKTAILKVGANSESELSYLRLKTEDGVNASRLALAEGVVMGGGVALLHVARSLPYTIAGNILKSALEAPLIQISSNAGRSDIDLGKDFEGSMGYDAKNDKFVDMWESGIVDAAKVIKNAVRNAVSLASTILTSGVVITIPQKSPEQIANEALKGKGLRF